MTGRGWGWAPRSDPSPVDKPRKSASPLPGTVVSQPQCGETGGTYAVTCHSSAHLMCVYSVNPHTPFMGEEVPSSPLYKGRN